jgi:hypothetical protein
MYPVINLKETGVNLRRIMDWRGITPKDVQKYLNLSVFMTKHKAIPIC